MTSPLERQWELLKLIPRDRKVTVAELRRKLLDLGYPVSARTIERDLIALSAQFFLECDDRSKPYGWRFGLNRPPLQIPGLTEAEAMSLILMETYLKNLLPIAVAKNLDPYFRHARSKFAESNPRTPLPAWLSKVRVVPPGQPLLAPVLDPEVQRIVYEAVLKNLHVEMRYQPVDKDEPRHYKQVNPLGLVQHGTVVYLVATLYAYDNPLVLALHRVRSATLLDTTCRIPEGFQLEAFIDSGGFGFGKADRWIELVAIFRSDAGQHLLETPLSQDQHAERLEPGVVKIIARILYTPQLVWWLISFGPDVEVLEPESLREEIEQRHRAACWSSNLPS